MHLGVGWHKIVVVLVLCQWTGRGGLGHPQGAVHMVAARLGCKGPWLGLGGAILTLAT